MPFYFKQRYNEYTGIVGKWKFALPYFFRNLSSGFSGILDRTFADFYTEIGVHFARYEDTTAVPRLVAQAEGVVLEVGPGSGNSFPRFNRAGISRIYGVEPNEQLFDLLTKEVIKKHDLSDIYVPIKGFVEDMDLLKAHGVGENSIDSVVCMQVLCSVSDPKDTVEKFYKLLKPGGQFLFWEHEANRDFITRIVQGLYNFWWSPLIGGCRLNYNITEAIMAAGDWEVVEFEHVQSGPWDLMPRVQGCLVKPQK